MTDQADPTEPDLDPERDQAGTRPLTRAERRAIIERSAIEAELETGRREPTVAAAKRSLLVRLATGALGAFLILAGLLMLVLPGPGVVAIVLGLGLLAPDVPFAARLMDRLKKRLPQDADGKLPGHVIVLMVVSAVAFTGGSLWWTFGR